MPKRKGVGVEASQDYLFNLGPAATTMPLVRKVEVKREALGEDGKRHGPGPRTTHITKKQIHELAQNKGLKGPWVVGGQEKAAGKDD